jgi:uncharacterized protein (DUF952 family)
VTPIFHITSASDWSAAQDGGAYRLSTRSRTLDEEGFIHCSEANQVARIANTLYSDVQTPLVVLMIAVDRLRARVRYENLDGGTEIFPHIYGALPVEAVISARPLQRDSTGRFTFTERVP